MPPATPDHAEPRSWQKWVVAVLGLVVLVHSVVLMVWLSPASPVRDAVGGSRLAAYVDPYFQQSRDTMGPGLQRVDETLRVRAYVRADASAEPVTTEWVDVTGQEQSDVRADVSPARVHLIARRVATNLNVSMFSLSPEQREVVGAVEAADSAGTLQSRLDGAGDSPDLVRGFMANEQMATQFASLYAGARFEGEVLQVQYRVGRRTVPAFEDRTETTITDLDFAWFDFGWRPAFRGSEQARAAFDSYVGG